MIKKLVKVYEVDTSNNLKEVEQVEIDFLREPSYHHLHSHLVLQWSNRRLGTASTKRRGEVRGGGRKPWAQKHTGRARHGSIRSPLWRKGGVVFGPKPRSWKIKMNKKERKLALYSLVLSKIDDFVVLKNYTIDQPKTKKIDQLMQSIQNLTGNIKKVTIMYSEKDQNVLNLIKSSRNHEKVRKILKANNLNVEDILSVDKVIMDKSSLLKIKELFIDFVNKGVNENVKT
ncbi:MAG: 50S ribosomal protein L4 [bacterium]